MEQRCIRNEPIGYDEMRRETVRQRTSYGRLGGTVPNWGGPALANYSIRRRLVGLLNKKCQNSSDGHRYV